MRGIPTQTLRCIVSHTKRNQITDKCIESFQSKMGVQTVLHLFNLWFKKKKIIQYSIYIFFSHCIWPRLDFNWWCNTCYDSSCNKLTQCTMRQILRKHVEGLGSVIFWLTPFWTAFHLLKRRLTPSKRKVIKKEKSIQGQAMALPTLIFIDKLVFWIVIGAHTCPSNLWPFYYFGKGNLSYQSIKADFCTFFKFVAQPSFSSC